MYARRLITLALALASSVACAESWPVHDLRTSIFLNPGITDDLGLTVTQTGAKARSFQHHRLAVMEGHEYVFQAQVGKGLFAEVDGHAFDRLHGNGIMHRGGFDLRWGTQSLRLDDFVLAPGFAPRTFEIRSRSGEVFFVADFAHFEVDEHSGRIQLFNLDLKIARALAEHLGQADLAGVTIGSMALELGATVPFGHAKIGTPPACGDWSGEKDVRLVDIGQVSQWSRQGGKVAITPSARLKNAGSGNVPWQSKFSPPAPPYNTDQHPYLVWALYRLNGSVFEQLGLSDVKHAFTTINVNCDAGACTLGNVLGLGCEDVYGVGTNQSTGSLSFRNEIQSALGLWNHTGSHFDQDGNGTQDHNGGDAFPIHRMAITESDLLVPGAQYFIEAWYVVRDDINIFNSMGWQRITPTQSMTTSNWTFAINTSFVNGSVLDAWVSSTAPPAGTMNTLVTLPEGHLRVAVKTTDLGGGQTRYEYALMNHDFDRQIGSFSIPTGGTTVTDLYFHDSDDVPGNNWTASQNSSSVNWTRPGAQGLDWGTMLTFGFTAAAPPVTDDASLAVVEGGDPAVLAAATLVPLDVGQLFSNDFE